MRRFVMAGMLIAAGAGCGELTEPQSQARLHGSWRPAQKPNVQHVTTQETLTFRADGSLTWEFRTFGNYGLAASDLAGYLIMSGTYTALDGAVRVRWQRRVMWDAFNGADSPEIVEESPPTEPMRDLGQFEVIHNMLIRRWTSYASDGPVPVTSVFVRMK